VSHQSLLRLGHVCLHFDQWIRYQVHKAGGWVISGKAPLIMSVPKLGIPQQQQTPTPMTHSMRLQWFPRWFCTRWHLVTVLPFLGLLHRAKAASSLVAQHTRVFARVPFSTKAWTVAGRSASWVKLPCAWQCYRILGRYCCCRSKQVHLLILLAQPAT
jgi:hypothetical protein